MLLLLLAGLVLAAAAAAAPQAAPAPATYDDWPHPKLGMVEVDRATNATIVSGKAATGATTRR